MIATLLFLLWLVACGILVFAAVILALIIAAPFAAILYGCWEAWRGRR
ncbi:hypothetical protein [Labrys sp. KNU-23]|nr:hypothetical protein [Labrys sp. KNU-23]